MKKIWIPLLAGSILTVLLVFLLPNKVSTVALCLFLLALFIYGGSLGVHTRTNYTMSHLPTKQIKHYKPVDDDDEEEEPILYKFLFFLSLPPVLYSLIKYLV
ncbi:hypothetical protein [Ammoniphilus sp. 3BR4]|uniref:hypothetical protein n=1 Tax=Ammoniphilus sp. 3BR4 TaxID=3158265 RepID=UPI003466EB1C